MQGAPPIESTRCPGIKARCVTHLGKARAAATVEGCPGIKAKPAHPPSLLLPAMHQTEHTLVNREARADPSSLLGLIESARFASCLRFPSRTFDDGRRELVLRLDADGALVSAGNL
eukprot:1175826-Prorocentrum_minimum.AAC.4